MKGKFIMSLVEQIEEMKERLVANTFPIMWGMTVEEWVEKQLEEMED